MSRKNNQKTLFCLLFCVILLLLLCSCGEVREGLSADSPSDSMPSEAPSESVTEAFGAGTEEETVMLPEYSGGHSLALPEREGERADFTVVIDAGHGQRDPGNMALDAKESDINLALSLRVCKLLSDMGYNVLLTRADDTAMLGADPQYDTDKEAEARRLWAVREGADLYISIHCNAADDANAKGTRLFYNNRPITSFAGRALALCYQNSLNDEFSAEIASGAVPAVKNNYLNGMQEDIYIVLQDVTMPAVLIEIGFMTNEKELAMLQSDDYLWEYAHALALGTDEARKTVLTEE